jgi:hypothetical protein
MTNPYLPPLLAIAVLAMLLGLCGIVAGWTITVPLIGLGLLALIGWLIANAIVWTPKDPEKSRLPG